MFLVFVYVEMSLFHHYSWKIVLLGKYFYVAIIFPQSFEDAGSVLQLLFCFWEVCCQSKCPFLSGCV